MLNKFIAVGTITSVKSTNKENTAGRIIIAVKTAHRVYAEGKGQNEATDDYFVLNFSDRQSRPKGIAKQFKPGDRVTVEGFVETFRAYGTKKTKDRPDEISRFTLVEIKHEETEFEQAFGIAGGQHSADDAVLLIEGTVESLAVIGRQGLHVKIGVTTPNGTSYVNAVAYNEQAAALKKLSVGNVACISIQPRTLSMEIARKRRVDFTQYRITGVAKPQDSATRSADSNKKPRRKRAKRPKNSQDVTTNSKAPETKEPITKRPNVVTSFTPSPVINTEIPEFDEE